ncbi:MAG: ECF transporter S component, partial [Lactobacillus iners]|nr:ECF transporter S component [Lactobacillus iners]
LGSVVMIAGYVVADSYLYSLKAGWLGIGTNILQALIGAIVSLSLYFALSKKIHNIFEIN